VPVKAGKTLAAFHLTARFLAALGKKLVKQPIKASAMRNNNPRGSPPGLAAFSGFDLPGLCPRLRPHSPFPHRTVH